MSDEFVLTVETFKPHDEFEPYPATLTGLEAEDGKFGPQVKWLWVLDEDKGSRDDGSDRVTFDWTPAKITPNNKTGKRIAQLTGRSVAEGEAYDLAKFIATRANLMFEHKKKDGKTVENIFAVKPIA